MYNNYSEQNITQPLKIVLKRWGNTYDLMLRGKKKAKNRPFFDAYVD